MVHVSEDETARLQASNPKGRLLEWCAKSRLPAPNFQRDASPEGYRIRAVMPLEKEIKTEWFIAPKLKIAEQAAAEAILQLMPTEALEPAPATTTPTLPTDRIGPRKRLADATREWFSTNSARPV